MSERKTAVRAAGTGVVHIHGVFASAFTICRVRVGRALLATKETAKVTFTYVPVKGIIGNLRTKYKNIKMNRWPPIQKECGICWEVMIKTIPEF